MPHYRAIGFDYGGVIGNPHKQGGGFKHDVCKLLEISREEYNRYYFSMNHLMMLGELNSWEEFWRLFLKRQGKEDKLSELLVLNQRTEDGLKVVDDRVLGLVTRLKLNYRVGLLSNTTLVGADSIRKLGVAEQFDIFHASAETKLMKPEPKAYQFFAKELGVDITELVFIDDAEKSLSTAEECGFTPILYTGYDDLVKKLKKLDIV